MASEQSGYEVMPVSSGIDLLTYQDGQLVEEVRAWIVVELSVHHIDTRGKTVTVAPLGNEAPTPFRIALTQRIKGLPNEKVVIILVQQDQAALRTLLVNHLGGGESFESRIALISVTDPKMSIPEQLACLPKVISGLVADREAPQADFAEIAGLKKKL